MPRPAALSRHGWWSLPVVVAALLGGLATQLDEYLVFVATSWLIFGLLGLSLDVVWGRAGVLSLGQTAFYGLGGYVASIVAINAAPLAANTFIWVMPVGAITGGLVAALVGWFIFYGRMGPLQTTILTYTFTLVLWTGAVSFSIRIGDAVVGGDNGMTNIPMMTLALAPGAAPLGSLGAFLSVLVAALAVYLAVQKIVRTPFGFVIDCIRMNDAKTELLGYDVRWYRLVIFTLGGAIAGIAGGLFGGWSTYLNPSVFSVQEALLVPIYVLVGGRGSLAGAFVGAASVGGLSFWLGGGVIGGQTTLVMGLVLIVLVLFLPSGLVGAVRYVLDLVRRLSRWRAGGEEREPAQRPADISARHLAYWQAVPAEASAGAALETAHLTKSFGGVCAVDNVSLDFESGVIRCLIGPNGAGKSTYLRLCMGLLRPDRGRVVLAGDDITRTQPYARVQAGLGIKMQITQVFEELTIRENLWIAAYARTRDAAHAERIAADVLPIIGLAEQDHLPGGALSHGAQQWLDIGMVLALAPRVVLLDEPTAGMTAEETRRTVDLIRLIAAHAAVVVVDHDMEFVRNLESVVTVLDQGVVFAEGRIEDLRKDERVLDIYLGRRESVAGL